MYAQQQRTPWSELLPDGRTVADALREKLKSPTTMPPTQPGQQVRWLRPDQHGALPQSIDAPDAGATAALPQPVNTSPALARRTVNPTAGAGLPEAAREKILAMLTNKGSASTRDVDPNDVSPNIQPTQPVPYPGIATDDQASQTRPWKAGYGVGETDPLKQQAARIRAMIENPTSQVNPNGSVDASHPMSKKKAVLLGLLKGIGEAAQGHEYPSLARVLAGGATGAVIGGVKPRAIQEWERRGEVEDAQGQLSQQTKAATAQAGLEDVQAQTHQRELAPAIAQAELERKARYDRDRLKIQQDAATGRISAAEATRRFNEQKLKQDKEQKELDRASREKIATLKPQTEIPDVAGQNAPDIQSAEAKIAEYQKELGQHQKEIATKHGLWKQQSENEYQTVLKDYNAAMKAYVAGTITAKPTKPLRKDFFDAAQNNDADFISGDYEKVTTRVKELQTALNEETKNRDTLKREVRQSQAKPRPRSASGGNQQGLSRGVFRQNNPEATKGKSDSQIDAMIRSGGFVPTP